MLQEAGQVTAPKPPSPTPAPKTIPFWRRIPATVYLGLGALALLVTLLEGYPWLSIEESGLLDPSNPYSQMFRVTNGGYIPVTDLVCICGADTTIYGNAFKNATLTQPLADYLGHERSVTLPCFQMFGTNNASIPSGSTLKVNITYALFYLDWKPMRKSQEFHFKSIVGRDKSQHWMFMN